MHFSQTSAYLEHTFFVVCVCLCRRQAGVHSCKPRSLRHRRSAPHVESISVGRPLSEKSQPSSDWQTHSAANFTKTHSNVRGPTLVLVRGAKCVYSVCVGGRDQAADRRVRSAAVSVRHEKTSFDWQRVIEMSLNRKCCCLIVRVSSVWYLSLIHQTY